MFGIALSLYEVIKAIAALEQCRQKCLDINLTDHAAAAQQAINELRGQ